MEFTFGIISQFDNEYYLKNLIESIIAENIPNFEIILVGPKKNNSIESIYRKEDVRHIEFDESMKKGWITKKKNLITKAAKYENIVYLHDYLVLQKGWYEGFKKFGDNFSICITKIINNDNTRYRDWSLSPHNYKAIDIYINKNLEYLLPYSEKELSKYMYISGAYWVAKKSVMTEFSLNENLSWGESEDVEWSHRVRKKHKFYINHYSTVKLQKHKDTIFKLITEKNLETFKRFEKNKILKTNNPLFKFIIKSIIKLNK